MIRPWRFLLLYVLLLAAGAFVHLHRIQPVPTERPLSDFPISHRGWRMVEQEKFSDSILKVLRATDYLSRRYVAPDGTSVSLYLGYYDGGDDAGAIHSPRHCLPGSGWLRLADREVDFTVGQDRFPLVEAVYQKDELKNLFLYGFHVRGEFFSDEYSLKLAEIAGSILEHRKNSAFLRISVPFDGEETKAAEAARRFLDDFYPVIQQFIPR